VKNTAYRRKEFLRMNELLFFIIGTMLGGLVGVVLMCLLQINRLSQREEVENAKTKCADTFPLE
jgi:H+/Cl- antiporter ClcA